MQFYKFRNYVENREIKKAIKLIEQEDDLDLDAFYEEFTFTTTLLQFCIVEGAVDLVRYLLEKGASLDKDQIRTFPGLGKGTDFSELRFNALELACEIFSKFGESPDKNEQEALSIIKLLIPQLKQPLEFGKALFYACENQWSEVVRVLVENEANVNVLDKGGLNPLHEIWSRHSDIEKGSVITEILLKQGADPNNYNAGAYLTPLIWAVRAGAKDAVHYLLKHGADIKQEDDKGRTAIEHAIDGSAKDIVEQLRQAGADFDEDSHFTLQYNQASTDLDYSKLIELSQYTSERSFTADQLITFSYAYTQVKEHSKAYDFAKKAISVDKNEKSFSRLIASSIFDAQFEQALQSYREYKDSIKLSECDNYCKANLIAAFVESHEVAHANSLIDLLSWQEYGEGAGAIYFNLACYFSSVSQNVNLALKALCNALYLEKTFEAFEQEKELKSVVETTGYTLLKHLHSKSDSSITLSVDKGVFEYATGRGSASKYDWQNDSLVSYESQDENYLIEHQLILTIRNDLQQAPFQIIESPALRELADIIIETIKSVLSKDKAIEEQQADEHKKIHCLSCEWGFADVENLWRWNISGHHLEEGEAVDGYLYGNTVVWDSAYESAPVWRYDAYAKIVDIVEQAIDWLEIEVSEPFYLQFQEHDSGCIYSRSINIQS